MSTWAAVVAFLAKYWRPAAIALLAGGLLYGAYCRGKNEVREEWDLEKAKTAEYIARLEANQGKETIRTITKYVDRIKVVNVKGDTIIKEVPKYVTVQNDTRCGVIGDGFVRLWNAANQNELPGTAGAADARAGEPGTGSPEGEPRPQ